MSRAVTTSMSVLLCSSAGLLATQNTGAAEWLISPTARVATEYADNPRLLDGGGISTAGAVGEISAGVLRRTERSDLSLSPRLRSSRYRDDESLESDDQYVDAKLVLRSERAQWTAAANLARDSTLTSEIGSTGIVQANRRHEGITLSGGPSFVLTERVDVGAQVSWLDSRYVDARATGLVDYEYRAASLFSGIAASELSDITLTAQGAELRIAGQDSRTRNATLLLAWRYELLSMWTLGLSAGPAFVKTDFGDDSDVVFTADLAGRGERWTLSASAGRDFTPTGRGVLTRRDQVVLSANRRMTERLSSGLSARWVRNQDLLPQPGVAFYEVEYGRLDLNLSWRFAEHWSLVFAVGAATQSYETRPGSAENHRTSLSIVWNGQQQPL